MAYHIMQVGLGDFGRRWLKLVHAHPSWEYAGIATRNARVRAEFGREVRVAQKHQAATLRELLDEQIDADALLVTTPHFCHVDDVALGLARGLNVLVEKPLAGSWSECLAIREAARAASGTLMVGENYRFGEGARLAREIVASGEIGRPEFLSMDYFVGHSFPKGDWRNDYAYPVLIENATHQFDLVRSVSGLNALEVFCTAFQSARTPHWSFPSVSAHFVMEDGFHFQFAASWSYDELRTPWEGIWRLYGSEGALSWSQDRVEIHRGGECRAVDVPSRPSDHTLEATLEEFTAALGAKRAAETDIEDNMQTAAMVFGAIRSSEQRVAVSIPSMLAESSQAAARAEVVPGVAHP